MLPYLDGRGGVGNIIIDRNGRKLACSGRTGHRVIVALHQGYQLVALEVYLKAFVHRRGIRRIGEHHDRHDLHVVRRQCADYLNLLKRSACFGVNACGDDIEIFAVVLDYIRRLRIALGRSLGGIRHIGLTEKHRSLRHGGHIHARLTGA